MATMAVLALLAEGGPVEKLLTPNPGLMLWTLVIFLALLLILWKFGWGKMIDALDRRDRAIRGSVEQAKHERQEAERLVAEAREEVAKARRMAAEAVAEAQGEAQRERQKLLDQGREEYEKIVARGREQIDQEARAAVQQVRQSVANLAVDVAGKLLQRTVDSAAQKQLAEQFVKELDSTQRSQ